MLRQKGVLLNLLRHTLVRVSQVGKVVESDRVMRRSLECNVGFGSTPRSVLGGGLL